MKVQQLGLGEFGRIARFFRPLAQAFSGSLDLRDDAALLTVPSGKDLIVTTDAIVEGVHFLPSDSAGDIARKALRVNLSDLAAKGAQPLAYTLTLATNNNIDDAWVESFAEALALDQTHFGISLAGGDSVSTAGPIWVSITAYGLVDAGRMVRRGGAKKGDRVFVTGTIGDAALGLAVLRDELPVPSEDRVVLVGRYRVPQPRNRLAHALSEYASAAIDISDGLAADFGHLCTASGVKGSIETALLPISPAARRVLHFYPAFLSSILSGGDDYEILFTVPPESLRRLQSAASLAGVQITQVGQISNGEIGSLFLDGYNREIAVDKPGWTHN